MMVMMMRISDMNLIMVVISCVCRFIGCFVIVVGVIGEF